MAYRNQIRQLGLATLILLAFACGCAGSARYQRRSVIFFDYFDTAIQFIAEVKSEEEFLRYAKQAEDRFQELHRLFNIYESYPDLINLCTINTNAGGEALAVSPEIIALLQLAREGYRLSGGLLDVTLGPLLRIWHDLRQEALQNPDRAVLPQGAELREALALGGFENLQIDEDACLVCLTKPGMSLDVGALAKGYATELVAHELFASGLQNFLLDAGGNIRTMGKPLSTDKLRWSVGLQNPQSGTGDNFNPVIDIAYIGSAAVVSSGGYLRFYEVAGERYHHIIDPQTMYPAINCLATTVISESSAAADLFSTITFLLSPQEAFALAEEQGLALLIVLNDGTIRTNIAMDQYLQSKGATNK